ncbi:hypothetical protein C8R45DRAFT_1178002 [Mycena sanguinolenta]|nr:hypothetical protein C8R45DRAFT_1178002 [Mycena sanguinolenta]
MLSARLSEREALILKDYGRDTIQDILGVIMESILCSAYGIVFAVGVYSIVRKGLRSRGSIVMLIIVIYLYTSAVVQWAADVSIALSNIHSLLMVPDVPVVDRGDLADFNAEKFMPPGEALFVFNMIIGDGIVIWRTWAIYQGRMLTIVAPCILLLVSFAPQDDEGVKSIKSNGVNRESTEKILALFVESGFIYLLLWLTQMIVYFNFTRASPWMYVEKILNPLGNQIAGLYPTLIIVIVNFQRTIWDSTSLATKGPSLSSSTVTIKQSGQTATFTSGKHIQLERIHTRAP